MSDFGIQYVEWLKKNTRSGGGGVGVEVRGEYMESWNVLSVGSDTS